MYYSKMDFGYDWLDEYGALTILLPVVPSNGNSFHGTEPTEIIRGLCMHLFVFVFVFECMCILCMSECECECVRVGFTCHSQA